MKSTKTLSAGVLLLSLAMATSAQAGARNYTRFQNFGSLQLESPAEPSPYQFNERAQALLGHYSSHRSDYPSHEMKIAFRHLFTPGYADGVPPNERVVINVECALNLKEHNAESRYTINRFKTIVLSPEQYEIMFGMDEPFEFEVPITPEMEGFKFGRGFKVKAHTEAGRRVIHIDHYRRFPEHQYMGRKVNRGWTRIVLVGDKLDAVTVLRRRVGLPLVPGAVALNATASNFERYEKESTPHYWPFLQGIDPYENDVKPTEQE